MLIHLCLYLYIIVYLFIYIFIHVLIYGTGVIKLQNCLSPHHFALSEQLKQQKKHEKGHGDIVVNALLHYSTFC